MKVAVRLSKDEGSVCRYGGKVLFRDRRHRMFTEMCGLQGIDDERVL